MGAGTRAAGIGTVLVLFQHQEDTNVGLVGEEQLLVMVENGKGTGMHMAWYSS